MFPMRPFAREKSRRETEVGHVHNVWAVHAGLGSRTNWQGFEASGPWGWGVMFCVGAVSRMCTEAHFRATKLREHGATLVGDWRYAARDFLPWDGSMGVYW